MSFAVMRIPRVCPLLLRGRSFAVTSTRVPRVGPLLLQGYLGYILCCYEGTYCRVGPLLL